MTDPEVHHHAPRDPGSYSARACGKTEPGERSGPTGTALPADARRGERDGEHPEMPGHRADDRGRMRHLNGRQPSLCSSR